VLLLLLWASAMAMEGQKNEMGARGLSGRGQGVIRRALAWLGRTGQGAGDARPAAGSTRRASSADGQPLNRPIQFVSYVMRSLTMYFGDVRSLKPCNKIENSQ